MAVCSLEGSSGKRLGRVLCVTSNFPRWIGDSTTPFVLHLAEDLQAIGWEVDVLAPHAERGTAAKESINGVSVERFSYLIPRSAQTVCYHGGALINLRKNPFNFLKLPALVFFQWASIVRLLRAGHYDVLHCHWLLPQGFTGVLAGRLLGVPVLTTIHGGDVFALNSSLLTLFKRFAINRADAVTVNSSATKAAAIALAPNLSNLQLVPMGIRINKEADLPDKARELRRDLNLGQDPVVLFLGRVVEEKGIRDFIQAIDILTKAAPNLQVKALVVGDGQDMASSQAMCSELKLESTVHFTGWVDPDETASYFSLADVFVGPSRTASDGWVEAQGLTFLEAMAAKTPVVATRSGGIIDTVEHAVTGLLVDEQSPDQIAAAITRILSEPELAESLVVNAYEQVVSQYSRESSASRFSALLSQLCRKNDDRPLAG